jgi:hypothetical protein
MNRRSPHNVGSPISLIGATFLIVFCGVVGVFVIAYLLLFDHEPSCKGQISCVLRANQGSLTALAVLIAATGVVTPMVVAFVLGRSGTADTLILAIDEVLHNLEHIAISFDREVLTHPPLLSTHHVERLVDKEFTRYLSGDVVRTAESLIRNKLGLDVVLGHLPATHGLLPLEHIRGRKPESAHLRGQLGLTPGENRFLRVYQSYLEGFIMESLQFVLYTVAGSEYDSNERLGDLPALRDLRCDVAVRKRLVALSEVDIQRICYLSSKRLENHTACWIDDCNPRSLPADMELCSVFQRLATDSRG